MKNLITIIACFSYLTMFSQVNQSKTKQVKALKIAFITNELALTPDEASRFWPIYNLYDEKVRNLRKEKKIVLNQQDEVQLDKLNDAQALKLLSQVEENEEQGYLLRKKFVTDIKAVVSPVKILKLKKAEDDFNRKLLKQYRAKR